MKQLVLGIALVVSQLATATSLMPPRPVLEPVRVKEANLRGNFMPPVIGPKVPSLNLKVQVPSNGCTDASDFKLTRVPRADGSIVLSIIRISPDHCRAFFPEGTEVEFNLRNVNYGTKLVVANPLLIGDETSH